MTNFIVNECVIEWIRGDSEATVTAYSGSSLKNKILKLREKTEVNIEAENKDGSICAKVPVEWVVIKPPKKLTEEQRQRAADRMREIRAKG